MKNNNNERTYTYALMSLFLKHDELRTIICISYELKKDIIKLKSGRSGMILYALTVSLKGTHGKPGSQIYTESHNMIDLFYENTKGVTSC